jgi:hypothetical protein
MKPDPPSCRADWPDQGSAFLVRVNCFASARQRMRVVRVKDLWAEESDVTSACLTPRLGEVLSLASD